MFVPVPSGLPATCRPGRHGPSFVQDLSHPGGANGIPRTKVFLPRLPRRKPLPGCGGPTSQDAQIPRALQGLHLHWDFFPRARFTPSGHCADGRVPGAHAGTDLTQGGAQAVHRRTQSILSVPGSVSCSLRCMYDPKPILAARSRSFTNMQGGRDKCLTHPPRTQTQRRPNKPSMCVPQAQSRRAGYVPKNRKPGCLTGRIGVLARTPATGKLRSGVRQCC